jgi:hypothetical protein
VAGTSNPPIASANTRAVCSKKEASMSPICINSLANPNSNMMNPRIQVNVADSLIDSVMILNNYLVLGNNLKISVDLKNTTKTQIIRA